MTEIKKTILITENNFKYFDSPFMETEKILGNLIEIKGYPKLSSIIMNDRITEILWFLSSIHNVSFQVTDCIFNHKHIFVDEYYEYIKKRENVTITDEKKSVENFFLHMLNTLCNVYYSSTIHIFNYEPYSNRSLKIQEEILEDWKKIVFYGTFK